MASARIGGAGARDDHGDVPQSADHDADAGRDELIGDDRLQSLSLSEPRFTAPKATSARVSPRANRWLRGGRAGARSCIAAASHVVEAKTATQVTARGAPRQSTSMSG